MKRYSCGKVLCITGGLLMGICWLGLFVPPDGEHSTIFWVALIVTSLGFILAVTGFLIAFLPRRTNIQNIVQYETYPTDKSVDYIKELESVRSNFSADHNPNKNQISYVFYPLAQPFYDYEVINSGKVYYGYLVDANSSLFKNKSVATLTYPAVAIFSTDNYFEQNPLALKKIARDMLEDSAIVSWIQKIVQQKREFRSAVQLPAKLTDGREIFITTVLIDRRQLPLGYLSDSLLPIIADPLSPTAVFAVDVKYWTKSLIGNFVNGCSKQ